MEITAKVFKRKSGKSKDKWIIRIEYFDEIAGRMRYMNRHADKRGEAIDERNRLVDEIKKTHGQMQTGERMTFNDLADFCEKNFYKAAVVFEGRKIDGVRSHKTVKIQINNLKQFFGKRLIRRITTESLKDYKIWRLQQGSKHPAYADKAETKSIKLSTVNRELSSMRRMMRYAFGRGWVLKDIFYNAKIIETSAEMERTRLLTLEEENRLLAACQGKRVITYERRKRGKTDEFEKVQAVHDLDNPHLKAILLLAIDGGLRRGEILKLRWEDFDFENGQIRILATHTKTERERVAPLSARAKAELLRIKKLSPGASPFNFANFKRSFETAKRLAGINDLHFHDLRRTAITRWIQQGVPLAFAGKLAGHTQQQTTLKHYTSPDSDIIREIAERMDAFHQSLNSNTTVKAAN